MNLTRMIFDYWLHWMHLSSEDNQWSNEVFEEGISWYDGYNANFWYLLNVRWYEMNDRQFAETGRNDEYCELRDFDEDYLLENGYK